MSIHAFQPSLMHRLREFNAMDVQHSRYSVINAITDLQVQAQLAESREELAMVRCALRELETLITAATDFVGAIQDTREQQS